MRGAQVTGPGDTIYGDNRGISREQNGLLGEGSHLWSQPSPCTGASVPAILIPPPAPRTWFAPPLEGVGLCARPQTQTSRSSLLVGRVLALRGDSIWSNGARRSSCVLVSLVDYRHPSPNSLFPVLCARDSLPSSPSFVSFPAAQPFYQGTVYGDCTPDPTTGREFQVGGVEITEPRARFPASDSWGPSPCVSGN